MKHPRPERTVADGLMRGEQGFRLRARVLTAAERARKARRSESVPHFHPPARRDFADDGRCGADRRGRVPAVAGLRTSAGRLPNHTGTDVLSWREPGGYD